MNSSKYNLFNPANAASPASGMFLAMLLCTIALLVFAQTAYAEATAANSDAVELQGIDDQVQTLKQEVMQINNELLLLEEKLLFPSTTQVAIFLSLTADPDFRLDAVELSLDQRVVANHIYTFRELQALLKGGVQRLHTGNIATGEHQIAITIRGLTANGDPFEYSANTAINKEIAPKFIDCQIVVAGGKPQIRFSDR